MKSVMAMEIKMARQGRAMTQMELANRLGWSTPQFISNIERGVADLPLYCFKRLSKVLGIPLENLIKIYLLDTEAKVRQAIGEK